MANKEDIINLESEDVLKDVFTRAEQLSAKVKGFVSPLKDIGKLDKSTLSFLRDVVGVARQIKPDVLNQTDAFMIGRLLGNCEMLLFVIGKE